jgi:hypothetical protein
MQTLEARDTERLLDALVAVDKVYQLVRSEEMRLARLWLIEDLEKRYPTALLLVNDWIMSGLDLGRSYIDMLGDAIKMVRDER